MKNFLVFFFIILNLVFGIAGALFIGFIFWLRTVQIVHEAVIEGSYDELFFYFSLLLGGFMILTAIVGSFAICYEKKVLLGFYAVFVVIFIASELGVGIFTLTQGVTTFVNSLEVVWLAANNESKSLVQSKFMCCGYFNASEWNGSYPSSCLVNETIPDGPLWSNSCSTAVLFWIRDNMLVLGSLLLVTLLLQICQIVLSVFVFRSFSDVGTEKRYVSEPDDIALSADEPGYSYDNQSAQRLDDEENEYHAENRPMRARVIDDAALYQHG